MQITTTQDRILHLLDRQKRSLATPSIGKDMEQQELLFTAGHCINWNVYPLWETVIL